MPLRFFLTDNKRGGLFKRKDLLGFIPELVVRLDIERHGYQLPGASQRPTTVPGTPAPVPASASVPAPPPHYPLRLSLELYGFVGHNDANHDHDESSRGTSAGTSANSGSGYGSGSKRYSDDYTKDYSREYSQSYSQDYLGFSFDDSRRRTNDNDDDGDGDSRLLHRRRRLALALLLNSLHFSFNRIAPRNRLLKLVVLGLTHADELSAALNPHEYKTTIADSLAHREHQQQQQQQRNSSGNGGNGGRRKRWLTTLLALNLLFHSTNLRHPLPTIAEFARQNASALPLAAPTPPAMSKIRVKPPQSRGLMDFPQPPLPLLPTEHLFGPVVRPLRLPSSYKLNGKTPLAQLAQLVNDTNTTEATMTKLALVPYNGRLAPKPERANERAQDRANERVNDRAQDRNNDRAQDRTQERAPERPKDRYGDRNTDRSSWHKRPQNHLRNYSSGTIHLVHLPALTDVPPVPPMETLSLGLSLGLRRFLKKFRLTKDGLEASLALLKKYSHPGRLLGTGASGLVLLVTSRHDNVVYAVKKFRPRQAPQELVQDYRTKVEVEFKIGQQLTHENVIHTIELITDMPTRKMISANPNTEPDYYIVMEYCAYDFFTLVMLGLMSEPEVACYFKQLVLGVAFLHSIGLAHRDLKLDNCVVNQYGQLKIIDFGSAVWFRGTQTQVQFAKGIVGSDPYLAPEVFEYVDVGYDPRLADVWLVAIIYCCMVLRRFPWKIPKQSDSLYRSFSQGQMPGDGLLSDLDSDYDGGDNPYGAQRLLRLLPREMRGLVKKMLTIDPERRYLIEDVANYPELIKIEYCHNLNAREYFIPNNHRHHLVAEDDMKKP